MAAAPNGAESFYLPGYMQAAFIAALSDMLGHFSVGKSFVYAGHFKKGCLWLQHAGATSGPWMGGSGEDGS